jgi:entericidin B
MGMFTRLFVAACLVLVAAGLAGCNTVRGFGRDLQRGGEMLQDAAASAHDSMRR